MKYEYLEHTADAKFRAYGRTIEEAFDNASKAMFEILIPCNKVQAVIKKEISVKTKKPESLLYDFLEELLFLLDTEGFLLSKTKGLTISLNEDNCTLNCVAFGDTYKNYQVSGNIKSITYNDMEIKKTKEGYELTVVVDL